MRPSPSAALLCAAIFTAALLDPSAAAPSTAAAQPPAAPTEPAVAARPSFADPSLSPDGREIAFVSGGDIWTVPSEGGAARLLVAHPATESRPLYSPDGQRLAFVSNRTGNGDVYVLDLRSGALTRVTFDDAPEVLDAWSADGRWLYFSSSAGDISGMSDVYRVRAPAPGATSGGGTPMPVAGDRYASEYWGAPSPDGSLLAITARGIVSAQWWRHGHSHLDESEIWLVRPDAAGGPSYVPATSGGAKSAWPMWAADGRTLYYMSDRSGAENLWAQPIANGQPAGVARQVTSLRDGRLLWPSVSRDGRTAVFERDFGIWRADLATGQATPVPITLLGAPAGVGTEHLTLTSGFQEFALAPDGRKLAVTARGEVFAAIARDATPAAGGVGAGAPAASAVGAATAGGEAVRVTNTPGREEGLAWSPDSRRVAYTSDRDGRLRLVQYDFTRRHETVLTSGGTSASGRGDVGPRWSPDGRAIAFVRDGRELRVVELDSAGAPVRERSLATALFSRPPFDDARSVAWSHDGRWIAYLAPAGARGFENVSVVPASGGASRPLSFVANTGGRDLSWSPDGTALYFVTGQRTESGQAARIDLVPRPPRFREDQFRDLFAPPGTPPSSPPTPNTPNVPRDSASRTSPGTARTDSALAARTPASGDSTARRAAGTTTAPAARPVRIDFDGIRQRLTVLPAGVDVRGLEVSPDGRQLLMVAEAAGQQNLWTWSLDELAREAPVARQLTSTAVPKADPHWSPDGREVYYREGGRIFAVAVDTRVVRPIPLSAELDVEFDREKMVAFREAWTYLRDQFYDPEFHGTDWNAVRARTAPQVAGARTPDELRRVLNLMIGELNASHSGAGGVPAQPTPVTGRLGVRFDRAAYEQGGALRVREVFALGPAAIGGVRPGDVLVAIEGRALASTDDLDERLAYTVGRRVALTVAGPNGVRREVALRPVALGAEKRLVYRAWVESRRAYVDSVSGHRLGYVHIPDMSAESLTQLYADLDAENQARDGVVIDIRNNNGGFINAYALDVFTRRPYLTMQGRDRPVMSARAALGQRTLERPTVLVTNQHSLSDAEDFSEGYRTLGLGRIVGEPTAGWIIYTSGTTLVDGTTLRLPSTRIRGADGTDMEGHPRPVDVAVTRGVGESYTGRDAQLDAAVRVLLGALASGSGRTGR